MYSLYRENKAFKTTVNCILVDIDKNKRYLICKPHYSAFWRQTWAWHYQGGTRPTFRKNYTFEKK